MSHGPVKEGENNQVLANFFRKIAERNQRIVRSSQTYREGFARPTSDPRKAARLNPGPRSRES
jgi:hypothetical protein